MTALGEATVRVGTCIGIPAVLRSLGADPAAVLAEVGIDPTLFDNPDNLVSFAVRGHLIAHCASRTGCRHFGLLIGQRAGLHSLGLLGLLANHSVDVASALRSLVGPLHLHVRGAVMGIETDDDVVTLTYDIYQPDVEGADQVGDGAVAMMLNVMRSLCGPDWQPIEARFAHRRPVDVRPFRRFFRVHLHFDAEHNALVFSRKWLTLRLPSADVQLQRLLQKQIDALDAKYGGEFPEQVRSVLRAALLTGHSGADEVAALFSIHSRTLNRRLRAFGTSYRELLDEGRFGIAQQMLQNTARDVSQIAASLDYADASAFTRAFRRWSGTTPAVWRATRERSS
jgi:AraC-like DNA-binding protein